MRRWLSDGSHQVAERPAGMEKVEAQFGIGPRIMLSKARSATAEEGSSESSGAVPIHEFFTRQRDTFLGRRAMDYLNQAVERVDLPVSGMSCENCVERVKRALAGLPGVQEVNVEIGKVSLAYYREAVSPEVITSRVEALGYRIPTPTRSRNPFRRFIDRMGEANAKALEGKRMDCCKIV